MYMARCLEDQLVHSRLFSHHQIVSCAAGKGCVGAVRCLSYRAEDFHCYQFTKVKASSLGINP